MPALTTFATTAAKLTLSSGYLLGLAPGTDKFVTDLKGWAAGAKMRRNSTERLNQPGNFAEAGTRDARYPSVSGHYVAPDRRAAQLFIDDLNAYLGDGEQGVLEVDDADLGTRWATVYLVGLDVDYAGGRDVSFTVDLEAPDPRKYGAPVTGFTGIATAGGGLQWDLFAGGPYAEARRNLLADPRATTLNASWRSSRWFGGSGSGTYAIVTNGTGPGGTPSTYIRKTWTVAPTQNGDTGFEVTNPVASGPLGMPVTPGDTVRAGGWLRTNAAGKIVQGRIQWKDAAGANLGYVNQPTFTLTANTWTWLDVSGVAPAGAVVCMPLIDVVGGTLWAVNDVLDGTQAMVERNPPTTTGPYFDGYTAASGSTVYAWESTADASPSIQSALLGQAGIMDYGAPGNLGTITLRNEGLAEIFPTYEVDGWAPDFTITEVETGRRLRYVGVVPEGQALTLDASTGAVLLEGEDRGGNLRIAEWGAIPPRSSRTYLFESPSGLDAKLTMKAVPGWY